MKSKASFNRRRMMQLGGPRTFRLRASKANSGRTITTAEVAGTAKRR